MRRLLIFLILIAFTAPALPAFAQDGKQAEQGTDAESKVVMLKLMSVDAAQPIVDYLSRSLHETIDAAAGMKVESKNDSSINEMVLVLGCDASSTDCVAGLSDFIQADRIAYGSIRQADGVYLISLKLFDFANAEFVGEVNDATVEGEPEHIKAGIDQLVNSLVYGDVGALEVYADGATEGQVYFDDENVGSLPATLDGLPLGEHVVTVETEDGRTQTTKVTLSRGNVSKVHLNFEPSEPAVADVGDSSGYIVPGWASMGVGTVGLVAGVIATVQLSSYTSEADSMICGASLCAQSSASQANRLQSNMDTAYTMSIVGYSVAAVGLAAGSYFLYNAYSGPSDETPDSGVTTDDMQVRFDIAPHADGASVGMGFDF